MEGPEFDQIGYWSEIKLDIIKDYAKQYSTILAAQPRLYHIYIDGFAGAGVGVSKKTGDFVPGSPLNALLVEPPFKEYHLVDLNPAKAEFLRTLVQDRPNVFVYEEDCNTVLLENVFTRARYADYRRALCILDPYGLQLNWEVIRAAGQSRSIEIFLNFPVMDMNRNVLWRRPEGVSPQQADRMTAFWGDESWRQAAYTTSGNLFGWEEKAGNEAVATAFQERLRKVAGFAYVPDPMPMRNRAGAVVYYLFFASPKPVAKKIVEYIFSKHKDRGAG